MYAIGQSVLFKMQRCACVGGGWTEAIGDVVGILHDGKWIQINQPSGIVTVKFDNIIKEL